MLEGIKKVYLDLASYVKEVYSFNTLVTHCFLALSLRARLGERGNPILEIASSLTLLTMTKRGVIASRNSERSEKASVAISRNDTKELVRA